MSLLVNFITVPKDESVDFLFADPAFFVHIADKLPLAAARHFSFMTQNPGENHATTGILLVTKLVHKRVNALPLHVLLDLDSLSSHRLLTVSLVAGSELPQQDVPGDVVSHFVDDITNWEPDFAL